MLLIETLGYPTLHILGTKLIDACNEASKLGIASEFAVQYQNDSDGVKKQYQYMSEAIRQARVEKAIRKEWKE